MANKFLKLRKKNDFIKTGTEICESFGKEMLEMMANKSPEFKEQLMSEGATFKEDNTMANGTSFYTTRLSKAIIGQSYDKFKQYYDLVWSLSKADLGPLAGMGHYKIPKVMGAKAYKLADGELVAYTNDKKEDILLETEDYAIGTKITRRSKKRYGPGIITRMLSEGSKAVQRAVVSDLINFMALGAANVLTGGVSYDKLEEAKTLIKKGKDAQGILFGNEPDSVGFSADGWFSYSLDPQVKNAVAMGQRNVPGKKLENDYLVIQGLKVHNVDLLTAEIGGNKSLALVVDSQHYAVFAQDEHEVFDGRLPGTAGSEEVIEVISAGFAIMNDTAACVVTE